MDDNSYEKRQEALWGHAGIEYEKLLIIDIALQFFEQSPEPQNFKIKTELKNVGALDDVVVEIGKSEEFYFYQVKHHYPGTAGDKYTFAALSSTAKEGHKKRVELYHFFDGWYQYIYKNKKFNNYQCVLFSNHTAAKNVEDCLDKKTLTFSSNFIEGKNLKKTEIEHRKKIFESIKEKVKGANDKLIKEFLKIFRFDLDQPSRVEYEKQLCKRFLHFINSDSENDFAVMKKYVGDMFFEDKAITPKSIKNVIININFEKNIFWFRKNSEYLLSKVRNKIGETQLKYLPGQISNLKIKDKKMITHLYGESGAGKTALIKSIFLNIDYSKKYLYLDAKDLKLFSNDLNFLFKNKKLLIEKIQYIIVDNIEAETDFSNLVQICHLKTDIKLIFITKNDDCEIMRLFFKKQDVKEVHEYSFQLLNESIINSQFPEIVSKFPEKLKDRITPFCMDKLVQLHKIVEVSINARYDLEIKLLDLWFNDRFKVHIDKVINFISLIAYKIATNKITTIDQRIFQTYGEIIKYLENNLIITCSDHVIKFSHDKYFQYGIYKYFENVYKLSCVLENNIVLFLDRCLKIKESVLFFSRNFSSFSELLALETFSSKIYQYFRDVIVCAIQYDDATLVDWCFRNLKIKPEDEVSFCYGHQTNYIMYAIEQHAENVLARLLFYVDHALWKITYRRLNQPLENDFSYDEGSDDFYGNNSDSSSEENIYTEIDDKYLSIGKYYWNDVRIDNEINEDFTSELGFRTTKVMHAYAGIEQRHLSLLDNFLYYLHRAIELKNHRIVYLLLKHNAKFSQIENHGTETSGVSLTNEYHETVLHLVTMYASFDNFKLCCTHFSKIVNDRDLDSETALHNAIYNADFFKALFLLAHGAKLDVENVAKLTPLHLAVLIGFQKKPISVLLIALLRYFNANPNVEDNESKTPLDLLVEINQIETEKLEELCEAFDSATDIEEYVLFAVEDEDYPSDIENSDEIDSFERSSEEKLLCMTIALLKSDQNNLKNVISIYLKLFKDLEEQYSIAFRKFIGEVFKASKEELRKKINQLSDEKISNMMKIDQKKDITSYFSISHALDSKTSDIENIQTYKQTTEDTSVEQEKIETISENFNDHQFSDDDQQEVQQLGWNCFDIAIGLIDRLEIKDDKMFIRKEVSARKCLVNLALSKKNNINFRKLLSLEIRHAALLDEDQMGGLPECMWTKELAFVVQAYQVAHQDEKFLEYFYACNELLEYEEGKRLSMDGLEEFFGAIENQKTNPIAYEQYQMAREIIDKAENELDEHCQRTDVYEQYLIHYYGKNEWFAFQRSFANENTTSMVDLTARLLNITIVIHENSEEKSEIYRTENNGGEEVHIIYMNNNHFISYEMNPSLSHQKSKASSKKELKLKEKQEIEKQKEEIQEFHFDQERKRNKSHKISESSDLSEIDNEYEEEDSDESSLENSSVENK